MTSQQAPIDNDSSPPVRLVVARCNDGLALRRSRDGAVPRNDAAMATKLSSEHSVSSCSLSSQLHDVAGSAVGQENPSMNMTTTAGDSGPKRREIIPTKVRRRRRRICPPKVTRKKPKAVTVRSTQPTVKALSPANSVASYATQPAILEQPPQPTAPSVGAVPTENSTLDASVHAFSHEAIRMDATLTGTNDWQSNHRLHDAALESRSKDPSTRCPPLDPSTSRDRGPFAVPLPVVVTLDDPTQTCHAAVTSTIIKTEQHPSNYIPNIKVEPSLPNEHMKTTSRARLMAIHKEFRPSNRRTELMSLHKELFASITASTTQLELPPARRVTVDMSTVFATTRDSSDCSFVQDDDENDFESDLSTGSSQYSLTRRGRSRRSVPAKDYSGMDGYNEDEEVVSLSDIIVSGQTTRRKTTFSSRTAVTRRANATVGHTTPSKRASADTRRGSRELAAALTAKSANEQSPGQPSSQAEFSDTSSSMKRNLRHARPSQRLEVPSEEPRPPLDAYRLYSQEIRDGVAAEHPDMSRVEIMAQVADQWQALHRHEKQTYINQANSAQDLFERQMKAWKALQRRQEMVEEQDKVVYKLQSPTSADQSSEDGVPSEEHVHAPVPRPRGRPKVGCVWDESLGVWRPDKTQAKPYSSQNSPKRKKTPKRKDSLMSVLPRANPSDNFEGGLMAFASAPQNDSPVKPLAIALREAALLPEMPRASVSGRLQHFVRLENTMAGGEESQSNSKMAGSSTNVPSKLKRRKSVQLSSYSADPVGRPDRPVPQPTQSPGPLRKKQRSTLHQRPTDSARMKNRLIETGTTSHQASNERINGEATVIATAQCSFTSEGPSKDVAAAKRNADWTFPKPRGRNPIGGVWNYETGRWDFPQSASIPGSNDTSTDHVRCGVVPPRHAAARDESGTFRRRSEKQHVARRPTDPSAPNVSRRVMQEPGGRIMRTSEGEAVTAKSIERRYAVCGRCMGCKTKSNCGLCIQCIRLREGLGDPTALHNVCIQRSCRAPVAVHVN